MRAVVATKFGSGRHFSLQDTPKPQPGPGQVLVSIRAAAVNFVDTVVAAGSYQVRPTLPFTPGGEFSGVVEAVGGPDTGFAPGDCVCGSGLCGALADYIAVPPSALNLLPDGMEFIEGATFRVANGTAMTALVQGADLHPGETVLVLGAGGAVGLAAITIAKALGATVIASASSEAKQELARNAGADVAISARLDGWRDRLKAALDGSNLDIVIDPVGGDATEPAFRSLGWGGRHLVIGFAGGGIPAIPTNLALVKGSRLVGVNFGQFTQREPAAMQANMQRLRLMWSAGELKSPPIEVYPFERFADAMEAAASRNTVGRTVLQLAY